MTFFRLLMLTVFFLTAATAEELEINGNFQSSGKENHTPRGWWPNLMGKPKSEVKMSISSADNNGIRSFDTETSEKILRFDTVNNLRIKVFPGDKLIFSGEAAGSKLEKAQALGVTVIDEARFLQMIGPGVGQSEQVSDAKEKTSETETARELAIGETGSLF